MFFSKTNFNATTSQKYNNLHVQLNNILEMGHSYWLHFMIEGSINNFTLIIIYIEKFLHNKIMSCTVKNFHSFFD